MPTRLKNGGCAMAQQRGMKRFTYTVNPVSVTGAAPGVPGLAGEAALPPKYFRPAVNSRPVIPLLELATYARRTMSRQYEMQLQARIKRDSCKSRLFVQHLHIPLQVRHHALHRKLSHKVFHSFIVLR